MSLNLKPESQKKRELEKLLYRSFDDILSLEETQRLQSELKKSKLLREERETILELRRTISDKAEGSFKPFFTERVMQRIHNIQEDAQEIFFEALSTLFRRLTLATGILLLAFAFYNLKNNNTMSLKGVFGIPEISLVQVLESEAYIDLESLE